MTFFRLFGPPNIEKLKVKGNVQRLIRALGYEKDENVRKDAASALGELGDTRAVEPLVMTLQDKNENVREAAAWLLGELGDTRAVEPLVITLQDKSENVRRTAAGALGKLGDARAVEPLVVALQDERWYVCMAAVGALCALGWQPINDVHRALLAVAHRDWPTAVNCGTAAVEPLVAALWNDVVGMCWKDVATALRQLGGDIRAVQFLVLRLQDKSEYMRNAAAVALEQLGDERAVESLVAALRDDHALVRETAMRALVQIGAAAVEPLVAALRHAATRGYVRETAMRALVQIGAAAVEPLVAALQDESWLMCNDIVEVLCALGWQPMNDGQRAFLAVVHQDWRTAVSCGEGAVKPLVVALQDRWISERAIDAPRHVLEYATAYITSEDLRAVSALNNVYRITGQFDDCGNRYSEPLDCAYIKQLARQELIRRGLKA